MWLRVTGDGDVIEGYPTPRSSRGGVDLVKPSAHGCPVIRRHPVVVCWPTAVHLLARRWFLGMWLLHPGLSS